MIIPGIRGFEVYTLKYIIISCSTIIILYNVIYSAENLGNTSCVYSTLDRCSAACLQLQLLVWR